MEENANGLGSMHVEYYYTGMYLDLARMEAFTWQVLQALYRVLREDYKGFEEAYNKRPDLFLNVDLQKMNGLVERYARCNDAALAGEMMMEYCELLMEI
jgi:lipid A disaccharide synthetase